MAGKSAKQEQFSDDDLEGLGPDEIAALKADQEEEESDEDEDPDEVDDQDTDDDDPGEDDPDEEDEDPEEQDDPDQDEDPDADPDDKGKKAKTDGDDDNPDEEDDDIDEPVVSKLPRFNIDEKDVKAAQDTLDSIGTERKELRTKFRDGDIDEDEYHDALEDLDEKRHKAQRTVDRAEDLKEHNEKNAAREWEITQETFYSMTDNKVFQEDPDARALLQIKLDQAAADPNNAKRSNMGLLLIAAREARKTMAKFAGEPVTKRSGKKAKTPAEKEIQRRRDKRTKTSEDLDKTLAGKTKAAKESSSKVSAKFEHLEGLNGLDLEEALANMTEAEQAEWAEK